jgi:prevent-host-death family protein
MELSITKLRQDLFRVVERAALGEPVEFTHKGTRFRIVPETAPRKLDRLVRQNVVAPESAVEQTSNDLLKEMEAEWQKDWAEL